MAACYSCDGRSACADQLAAAILDQLYGIAFTNASVRPRYERALHPVIDHRRVPGLLHGLEFLGWVVGVLYLRGNFKFEGIECACSRCDAFLRHDLGCARALPAYAGCTVEIGGFERPGLAHSERRPDAGAVIRRISPDAVADQIP